MRRKPLRSLVIFVLMIAVGTWYFADTRTPEQRSGQVAVEPGQ